MAARGLGPLGYGAFAASLAHVSLWAVVMDGGIGLALTREASADPRRLAWAPRFAIWRTRLALLGMTGAVVSAWMLQFEARAIGLVAILAAGMAGLTAIRFASAIFRALGRFTAQAVVATAQKLILVLLTAGGVALAVGVEGVALAFTLSYAVVALPALAQAWRAASAAPSAETSAPAGFFLRTCVPLFAIELFTALYFRVDQVLLLRLRGPEETGVYAVAFRVVEALLLLVAGVMTVLFPRLAASVRGAPDTFRRDFQRAWRVLWLGGTLIALNGWLWAVSLMPRIFGSAYAAAETVLAVLLGAVPLAYVNALLTQSLVAAGRERVYALGAVLCTLANVGLNVLLIPRWGAAAAAWVTIATEGVLLVVCVIALRPLGHLVPLSSTMLTGAAVALATVVGWWMLADRPLERGLFALAVSVVSWELVAPWPLRRLRRVTAGPRIDTPRANT
jgi:O-antigen/teichoic acid export membrane protein